MRLRSRYKPLRVAVRRERQADEHEESKDNDVILSHKISLLDSGNRFGHVIDDQIILPVHQ